MSTNLHLARGLGSAKSGLHHWILQRITAIGLIPLGLWFVYGFITLATAPYDIAHHWLNSPWTATAASLFIIFMFYHGCLGLQVILEDYVPHFSLRWCFLIVIKLFSILMTVVTVIAILRIFLS
jgi:succinate dehydrogenase / fumarate reductase membrane anchor subunit